MWSSPNQNISERNATKINHFRKQPKNADVDLTELVAKASAAQRQIQPKILSPMASSMTTPTAPIRSTTEIHKNPNQQNKSKTSAEIINETKNMLAHGMK